MVLQSVDSRAAERVEKTAAATVRQKVDSRVDSSAGQKAASRVDC